MRARPAGFPCRPLRSTLASRGGGSSWPRRHPPCSRWARPSRPTPRPPVRPVDAVTNREVDAVEEARGKKGLLVAFICNHCPFVKHIRQELVRVAHETLDRGLAVLAVN